MPITLQDILAQAGAQNGPPMATTPHMGAGPGLVALLSGGGSPGGPPPAPTMAGAGDPLQAQIDQIIASQGQPVPVTDEPIPQQPKTWQKIGGAIADAISAYAAGLGSGAPPTNVTGGLIAQESERSAASERNKQRRKEAGYLGTKAGDEAKLRELIRQVDAKAKAKADEADLAEKAADRTTRAETNRLTQAAIDQRAQEGIDARKAAQEDKQKFDEVQKGLDRDVRLELADVRAELARTKALGTKTDKYLEDQKTEMNKARNYVINEIKPNVMARIEAGESPAKIRETWTDLLDASDLDEEHRKAIESFFELKVGSILAPLEKATDDAEKAKIQKGQPQPTPTPGFRATRG